MSRGRKFIMQEAVDELKAYFGALTQDDLFSVLLGASTIEDIQKGNIEALTSAEKNKKEPGVHSIVRMLQSQETGFFAHEIIDEINKLKSGASDAEASIGKIISVVYENSASTVGDKIGTKTLVSKSTAPVDGSKSAVIMDNGQKFEPLKINESPNDPSKDKPSLVAFVVKPHSLNPSKKGCAAAEIFLNTIPTIEMSRCVPFLDITLIPSTPALSDDGKVQTASLLQFLEGNFTPTGKNKEIAEAVDLKVRKNNLPFSPPKVADESKKRKDPSTTSAGMEIFTTPQTILNGDEYYTGEISPNRGAAVIDRFRPFMSIKDFKVDLVPSAGLLTFKSAQLNLVLHDRSRLSEISEFVKPDLYGKTHFLITYGWSHPDSLSTENVYGKFLDSLKCTEKYRIVNSSFSFDDVGQVSISLKLSLEGSSQVQLTKIHDGQGVNNALKDLDKITEAIKAHRKKLPGGRKGTKKVSGSSILSKLSDTGSAISLDKEGKKKIDEFLKSVRGSNDKNLKALIGPITKLKKAIPKAQSSMGRVVARKVKNLTSIRKKSIVSKDDEIKDPFMVSIEGKVKKFVSIDEDSRQYISFGQLLLNFVGHPLASTGQFDEIQFVFYAFNKNASYVHGIPISSFPIHISDFQSKFNEACKTSVNMSLGGFISFMGKNFISSQTSRAYGLTDLYEDDKDNPGKQKLAKKYEDKTVLASEKEIRLKDAYGIGEDNTGDIKFKVPRIKMQSECLNAQDDGKTIYRIHIFDQNASSHTTMAQIWQASQDEDLVPFSSMVAKSARKKGEDESGSKQEFIAAINHALKTGVIEVVDSTVESISEAQVNSGEIRFRVKQGYQKTKEHLMSIMPTIVYGSSATNVLSAKVASMNNPAMTNVMMRRSGLGDGVSALGLRETGLPLQIAPVKLSMETLGCPVASIGQNFFVDFGTGTSTDNIYTCNKVSHSISPGTFKTNWEFMPLNSYGQYTSLGSTLDQALTEIKSS